jgi:hypothetical protein
MRNTAMEHRQNGRAFSDGDTRADSTSASGTLPRDCQPVGPNWRPAERAFTPKPHDDARENELPPVDDVRADRDPDEDDDPSGGVAKAQADMAARHKDAWRKDRTVVMPTKRPPGTPGTITGSTGSLSTAAGDLAEAVAAGDFTPAAGDDLENEDSVAGAEARMRKRNKDAWKKPSASALRAPGVAARAPAAEDSLAASIAARNAKNASAWERGR